MNAACNSQAALIDRYVRQLRVRSERTRPWYANEIRAFYRFLARATPDGRPTQAAVIAWIRERSTQVSEIVVADRARKIHGYLEYLVERGLEASNPFAQLCERHGERSLAPVIRAASAADPATAFAALLKPPPWSSSLGPIMRDHVTMMRAVGYRYRSQEERFRAFDRFLQSHPELAGQPLEALIEAWTGATPTKAHAGQCELVGRLLSRVMHRLDPRSKTVDVDRGLRRRLYGGHRRPYIYSAEELARLFAAARALRAPRSPLLPATVYTMLVLAYCAALRLGELVHLTVGDVDVPSGLLTVRNTKFFKSRQVPLHPSAMQALEEYLAARRRAGGPTNHEASLFWHEARQDGYSRAAVASLLVDALRAAGLKPARGKVGPRVHDLRHAFVVHRLLKWYEEGIDPEPLLPYLATYLGHKSIHSTLIYITVTSELLQHAAERFRRRGAASLRTEGVLS
jgi:site-specific recombinase XerD